MKKREILMDEYQRVGSRITSQGKMILRTNYLGTLLVVCLYGVDDEISTLVDYLYFAGTPVQVRLYDTCH